jgi:Uma2 family endonuclease
MRPHLICERDGEEPLYVPIAEEIVAEGVTFEEFLTKEWVKLGHVEWVNGYVVKMATIEFAHDQLVVWLRLFFRMLMEQLGGTVVGDPMVMYLENARSGRAPDVQVLLAEHTDRVLHNRVIGPADLVIEVVSPGSRRRDTVTRLLEYERGGVPEYWILDPIQRTAAFFVREEDGEFVQRDPDEDGVYHCVVIPELALPLELIWQGAKDGGDIDEISAFVKSLSAGGTL